MLALFTLGCKSDSTAPEPPGPPITSTLTCQQPDGRFAQCELTLQNGGGFQITLGSINSCGAHGNAIRLTKPVSQVLTEDACYASPGAVWRFDGPFAAGTAVALELESPELQFPPGLRLSGTHPLWTVSVEDGGDADFDDFALDVQALP